MPELQRAVMSTLTALRVGTVLSTVSLMLVLSVPAQAQSRATLKEVDQRLERVERVLDQSLLELLQQVETLKREIRQLRGELERERYELDNLRKRSRDLYLDTDQRLNQLERGAGGSGAPLRAPLDSEPAGSNTNGSLGIPAANSVARADSLDNRAQPPPAEAAASESTPSRSARSATPEEKQAYTAAYDLLASGQNAAARTAFEAFVQAYPDGPFTDNAWYWFGESSYAERDFENAMRSFDAVVKQFPNSPKVPDAKLKIGFALIEMERYKEARNLLNSVLSDYPGRSAAVLARKRLQDMDSRGL